MSKYTLLFDFDGTLADTFQLVIDIVNESPKDFGIDGIDQNEISELRNLSPKYMLQEFGIKGILLPVYLARVRTRIKKKADFIKLYPGIKELLLELEGKYNLAIVSGNSPATIRKILIKNELNHLFTHVIGDIGAFKKDNVLAKFLRKEKLDPTKVLYIGDEVRDVEAAKDVHINMCAVTWGFNSKTLLAKHAPDFLVENISSLRDVVFSQV